MFETTNFQNNDYFRSYGLLDYLITGNSLYLLKFFLERQLTFDTTIYDLWKILINNQFYYLFQLYYSYKYI